MKKTNNITILFIIMIISSLFIVQIQKPTISNQENISNYLFDNTTATLTYLNSWDENFGVSYSIVIDGNFAYVGVYDYGVLIFDITEKSSPQLVSKYEIPLPDANVLAIYNNLLFVDTYVDGIFIIDVSDPYNPNRIGTYSDWCGGNVKGFVVKDNLCYSVSDSAGLAIINISDPSSPNLLYHYDDPFYDRIFDVDIQGNFAYLACYDDGILVLNISDPTAPFNVSSLDNGGYSYRIFIHGRFAYTIDQLDILEIIDIDNPSSLSMVSTYSNNTLDMVDVVVENNVSYVCCGSYGVEIIDTSDILNPTRTGSIVIDISSYIERIQIENSYLYLTDFEHGLIIADVTPYMGLDPEILSVYGTNGYTVEMVVDNGIAYLANSNTSLMVVNVTETYNLHTICVFNDIGNTWSIDYKDNFIFLGDYKKGLVIVDVSNLLNPVKINEYNTGGLIYDLCITSNFSFLAGENGLEILDISNYNSISYLSGYQDSLYHMKKIQVKDDIFFSIGNNNKFYILKFGFENTIIKIGEYLCTHSLENFYINNNHIYLVGNKQLTIIDISNLSNPLLVNTFTSANYIYDIFIQNNVAVLLEPWDGIRILDITNPSSLTEIYFYEIPDFFYQNFVYSDNYIYVTDSYEGFDVFFFETNYIPPTTTFPPSENKTEITNNTNKFTMIIPGFTLLTFSSGIIIIEIIVFVYKKKKAN